MVERYQRLLEAGYRLAMSGACTSRGAGTFQVGDRFVPQGTLLAVSAQGDVVGSKVTRVERLHGVGDRSVQEPAARCEQALIGDLADAVVREVQPFVHRMQNVAGHQFLDRRSGLPSIRFRGPIEQREIELPSDDARQCCQVAAAPAEPLEPPGDDVPDASRRRVGVGIWSDAAHAPVPYNARMVSTTMNGLPSLACQICVPSRCTAGSSVPVRASKRTRVTVSGADKGANVSDTKCWSLPSSRSKRATSGASITSSLRIVATRSI